MYISSLPLLISPDGDVSPVAGNPMPVSKSGYCRLQGSFTCFLKCDHAKNCPSQLGTGAEANKAAGGCNSAMMWSYSSGKQHCMPIPGEL